MKCLKCGKEAKSLIAKRCIECNRKNSQLEYQKKRNKNV